jgi:hypothetical protein
MMVYFLQLRFFLKAQWRFMGIYTKLYHFEAKAFLM